MRAIWYQRSHARRERAELARHTEKPHGPLWDLVLAFEGAPDDGESVLRRVNLRQWDMLCWVLTERSQNIGRWL